MSDRVCGVCGLWFEPGEEFHITKTGPPTHFSCVGLNPLEAGILKDFVRAALGNALLATALVSCRNAGIPREKAILLACTILARESSLMREVEVASISNAGPKMMLLPPGVEPSLARLVLDATNEAKTPLSVRLESGGGEFWLCDCKEPRLRTETDVLGRAMLVWLEMDFLPRGGSIMPGKRVVAEWAGQSAVFVVVAVDADNWHHCRSVGAPEPVQTDTDTAPDHVAGGAP